MGQPVGQIKTFLAYLFVVCVGIYVGHQHAGLVGGIVGAVIAIPVALIIGLFGVWLLATMLGYYNRELA